MIRKSTQRPAEERTLVLVFLLAALVAVSLLAAKPAHASTTFTVNDTTNDADLILNDSPNACDVNPLSSGNQCTLRAAIQEANNTPGLDTINFNIPGSGTHTIAPTSVGLPALTDPVIINGYSQPGAKPNTLAKGNSAVLKIELSGVNAGANTSGLVIGSNASNTVIKGLVINRFTFSGIQTSVPSTSTGIKVEGNFIGTDASGTADLGNTYFGVALNNPSSNTVGGTLPEARNVISGNGDDGIAIGSRGSKVMGNLIGTKKDGTSPLGNDSSGVHIPGDNIAVGGTASGAANVIAFNGSDGVTIFSGTGNRILSNSIHSNAGLGIDLGGGGPHPNDTKDPDTGANNLQNYPVLISATTNPADGSTTVTGKLNSRPRKTFTIQFFSNPSGSIEEGKTFLGQKKVKTNKKGNRSFAFTTTLPAGFITATATGSGGTSEFSTFVTAT
jgi:CSLREA domain-containing protein